MPVDLPPEVIEEAVAAIGFTERAVLAGAAVTASFEIRSAAPIIASYVRVQTLKEVRAVVEPFQVGTEVSDAIDRLAKEGNDG
ncbi:hypothetical protein [Gryllotalpicola koreensis]|uniref:Uncharacterized protein n=1 Tax=Gryllotalpicola koreensis TaxID=993086 RepID=A0ABP8A1Y8_9MICO